MSNILLITASALNEGSDSRKLGLQLAEKLAAKNSAAIIHRNLNNSELPLIDSDWVAASFTPADARDDKQKEALALSDLYVDELKSADTIIVAAPIYNFGVPASLKAYFDLITRAGLTFQYTETGPVSLLENKTAHIVTTSGGVPINSPMDFATPLIAQVLSFNGIEVVNTVDATGLSGDPEGKKLAAAEAAIAAI